MCDECENNLFIYLETDKQREYFKNILDSNTKLFEGFIPLSQTKLECYGTSSDVYLEYTEIFSSNECRLCLKFYTYQTPCIEFVKKLAARYGVNVEYLYYSDFNDISGHIIIYRNQLVKEEKYSYYQGLYFNKRELFWEYIYKSFTNNSTFMDFYLEKKLFLSEKDFEKLKCLYDEFLFCGYFSKTI